MKTIIVKTLAVLLMLLGLIHDIATFTPLMASGIDERKLSAVIYMSLMCGTSLILCGALLYLLMPKAKSDKSLIVPVRIIGLFLALAGILAVYFMPYNPFAWITLVLCVAMCAMCFIVKNQIVLQFCLQ